MATSANTGLIWGSPAVASWYGAFSRKPLLVPDSFGDYYGATGEVTIAAGLGANVLVGGSNRTIALQPISISGQKGLNFAVGVAALHLGPPGQ